VPARIGATLPGVAKPYDYVELTAPAGEWPAGTRGHLIEVYAGDGGLVEVDGAAESESPALDFLVDGEVATLRVLEPAPAQP
jgi:hypothetical protein